MIALQERVHGTPPPNGWNMGKLSRVLMVRKGHKNKGMIEENLLSLSYGHIVKKDIGTTDGLLPEGFETYQIVDPGNIIMRLTDVQNDKRSLRQGLVRQRGIITSAYDALEVNELQEPRYWAYTLLALDLAKYYYSLGGGVRQSIKFADFSHEWITYPDLPTQRVIADFLDRETARIDQLIEKKQRMVEVLGEKRAATITRSVCGDHRSECLEGRDQGAAEGVIRVTKYQLPPLLPLKRLAAIHSSNVDKVVENDEIPIRLCNYVDVYHNDQIHPALEFSSGSAKQSEIDRFGLRPGDVLITKDSETPNDIAVPALVIQSTDDLVCGYHLALLRPNPSRLSGTFLFYALKSRSTQAAFSILAQGITRFGLTLNGIGSVPVPLPDLPTQEAIIDFLDGETASIDALITKIRKTIDRLREFRSALITAAVTGQIDVSTWGKQGTTDHRFDQIEEATSA